ncbi:MAG: serine/threonine protein kinase [Gemmataceae bacterium]
MGTDTTKPPIQTIGNYDLLVKVAEGGMGAVYRGRHRETGEIVALKVLASHLASNPVLLKRFEQEFRAASAINHPNVVRALDYCGTGSTPFLVMEFVEGESLGQKLEREGKMPETEAIRLIAQVCQGLHRAHKQGIIHRDVKPDNIMVTPDGQAKLTDLGLVKDVDAELNLTRTGRGLGTPHFMAPEQFRNAKSADIRCDVYSIAATLYMMVTGNMPFKNCGPLDAWMKKIHNELTPPRKLVPSLSERVDWAIRRAMSADPQQRPASCREFFEDLTGQSTRRTTTADAAPVADIWYLVYKDEEGTMHTVKGSTEGIRRSLKEGLLGDASNVRACRTKNGPFESLRGFPEFRDIVIAPAPLPVPGGSGSKPVPAASSSTSGRSTPLAGASSTSRVRSSAPSSSSSSAVWGKVPTPLPSTPPPAAPMVNQQGEEPSMPHIPIETHAPETMLGWLKWMVLFAIMIVSAIVASYFLVS